MFSADASTIAIALVRRRLFAVSKLKRKRKIAVLGRRRAAGALRSSILIAQDRSAVAIRSALEI